MKSEIYFRKNDDDCFKCRHYKEVSSNKEPSGSGCFASIFKGLHQLKLYKILMFYINISAEPLMNMIKQKY